MAELYTITLEDQVTGNAYRIAKAYTDVSIAAQYLARSVKSCDADMVALDRHQLQQARVQLMAAKAAQSAGNAISRLGPKMAAAKTASNALTSSHARGTAGAFKFSYALNALAQSSMNTAFSLAGRLVDAAADAGKGLYDVADLATRAHMSFANFFGGQAAGDRMLQESIDIAKRYGFTIEDTVAQVQRFGAAGFNTEQSKGLLRFGADMMAAGRTVQDVKGIFLAMTQIQGKGKLQAEELTQQLAERGINAGRVWEILAKKFNTTKEGVMKMQKAGKIGPGAALNAIVQAGVEGVHGSAIGEAGKKVADATIGGLSRKMSTEIESQIFAAVDNATPRLVGGMQMIFAGLTGIEGGKLQDSLTNMLNGVGDFMGKVGPQLPEMADNFQRAFGAAAGFDSTSLDSFAKSLPKMASDLGTIAGFFVTIASAAAKVASFSANAVAGTQTDQMLAAADKAMGTGAGLNQSEGKKSTLDLWTENAFNKGKVMGEETIDGLNFGVDKSAPSAAKAVENAADGMIDAGNSTLGIQSPSKVFKRQGQYVAEGFALGVDSNADLAMHSTQMMSDSAAAAGAGASGLDPRRALAAGAAAGTAVSSSSRALTVSIGDLYISGAGGGSGGGADAAAGVREYFEGEFCAMLERHLEGVGA